MGLYCATFFRHQKNSFAHMQPQKEITMISYFSYIMLLTLHYIACPVTSPKCCFSITSQSMKHIQASQHLTRNFQALLCNSHLDITKQALRFL